MKKFLCSLVSLFFVFSLTFASEKLISYSAGISSGIPFYGKNGLSEAQKEINPNYRVIIGTFANINLNIIEQVTFSAGAEILSDLNWQDDIYNNHLHVGFPLGFKIYPDIGGLNFGLAYDLGFRSDFYKNADGAIADNIASWGNGFKISMEYNFNHNGDLEYLPSLGCSWTLMPRGNYSYDNLITFYLAENF